MMQLAFQLVEVKNNSQLEFKNSQIYQLQNDLTGFLTESKKFRSGEFYGNQFRLDYTFANAKPHVFDSLIQSRFEHARFSLTLNSGVSVTSWSFADLIQETRFNDVIINYKVTITNAGAVKISLLADYVSQLCSMISVVLESREFYIQGENVAVQLSSDAFELYMANCTFEIQGGFFESSVMASIAALRVSLLCQINLQVILNILQVTGKALEVDYFEQFDASTLVNSSLGFNPTQMRLTGQLIVYMVGKSMTQSSISCCETTVGQLIVDVDDLVFAGIQKANNLSVVDFGMLANISLSWRFLTKLTQLSGFINEGEKVVMKNCSVKFVNIPFGFGSYSVFGAVAGKCTSCVFLKLLVLVNVTIFSDTTVTKQIGGLFGHLIDSNVSFVHANVTLTVNGKNSSASEEVGCVLGFGTNINLKFLNFDCIIKNSDRQVNQSAYGGFGSLTNSEILYIMMSMQGIITSTNAQVQISIGGIGSLTNSKIDGFSTNITSLTLTGKARIGGVVGVAVGSSIQRCFSFGTITVTGSQPIVLAGLIGVLTNSKLLSSYSWLVPEEEQTSTCFNGIGESDALSQFNEVLCFVSSNRCGIRSNYCFPPATLSQFSNSFGICADTIGIENCFSNSDPKDPQVDKCLVKCIDEIRLRSSRDMKQVLKETFWNFDSGVNTGFPSLKNLWNYQSDFQFSSFSLDPYDARGIKFNSQNHIVLIDGPNLCRANCKGTLFNFYEGYICASKYLLIQFCEKMNCSSPDNCLTANSCNLVSGQCDCLVQQYGVYCEISRCEVFQCPSSSDCVASMAGTIHAYRCNKPNTCADSACSNCVPNYKGTICSIQFCNSSNQNSCGGAAQGTCTNQYCVCKSGFINVENFCYEKTNSLQGQCYKNKKGNVMCITCAAGFAGPTCNRVVISQNLCTDLENFVENNRCVAQCVEGSNCLNGRCGEISNWKCVCNSGSHYSVIDNNCYQDLNLDVGACYNFNNLRVICVSCIENYTLKDEKCEDCSSKYIKINNKCLLKCRNGNDCNNHGTCDNLSGICTCNTEYDNYNCGICSTNFVMDMTGTCVEPCKPSRCFHGECSLTDPSFCVCQSDHSGFACDKYICSADKVKPCNTLGKCLFGKCVCGELADSDVYGNCQLLQCSDVVNGVCKVQGVQCWSGWSGEKCELYDCRLDSVSPCNNLGVCDQTFGICSCESTYSQFNGTCLPQCSITGRLNQLEAPTTLENSALVGGVFSNQTLSQNIRTLCSYSHVGCLITNGKMTCNKYVNFSKNGVNHLVPYQCNIGRYGDDCMICLAGQREIDELCYFYCEYCNGDCYLHPLGSLTFCFNCETGYDGDDCTQCVIDYTMISGVCFKTCKSCNGDCYYTNGNTFQCRSCNTNFDILSQCVSCVQNFEVFSGQCLKRCDVCTTGDCFVDNLNNIYCKMCNVGFVGQQCDRCQVQYVMIESNCYPIQQGSNGQCAMVSGVLTCVSCNDGYSLGQDKICRSQCIKPECVGGTCQMLTATEHLCVSCFDGFTLKNNACWQQVANPHGTCLSLGQTVECICFTHYSGALCQNCSSQAMNIDGDCALKCTSCDGDCWQFMNQIIHCFTCNQGYVLPNCSECAFGYVVGHSDKCDQCDSFAVSGATVGNPLIPTDSCVVPCMFCPEGNCFYNSEALVCIACNTGYKREANCQSCTSGWSQTGKHCFQEQQTCVTFSNEQICKICQSEQFFGHQCSSCSSMFELVNGVCVIKPIIYPGDSYIIGSTMFSSESYSSVCLLATVNEQQILCEQCSELSHLVLKNNQCYYSQKRQALLFNGECYISYHNDEVICDKCDDSFQGVLCDLCNIEYYRCYEDTCCQLVNLDVGFCYEDLKEKRIVCLSCISKLQMENDACVEKTLKMGFFVYFLIALLFLIILFITLYYYMKKYHPVYTTNAKRKLKIIIATAGLRIGMIILAQIISIASAFQDMFLNSVTGYSLSQFISAIPYACIFFFLEAPKMKRLVLHKGFDTIGFAIAASMETLFQLILYNLLPVPLQVSEQLFKALSAPLAMMVFIVIASFKFGTMQIGAVLISILGAVIFLISKLIISAFTETYFFIGETTGSILLSVPGIILLASTILIQLTIMNIILNRYTEIQAIGRQSMFALLITGTILLFDMNTVVTLLTENFQEVILSVCLQAFIPLATLIVMNHLRAVELFVNLATSAIWVSAILETVSLFIGLQFLAPSNIQNLVFSILAILLVFIGLIVFYVFSNNFYVKANDYISRDIMREFYDIREEVKKFVAAIKIEEIQAKVRMMTLETQKVQNLRTQTANLRSMITGNQTIQRYFEQATQDLQAVNSQDNSGSMFKLDLESSGGSQLFDMDADNANKSYMDLQFDEI